jgi:hypothetical protein
MTDIVKRLRDIAADCPEEAIFLEAAAVIEELRATLDAREDYRVTDEINEAYREQEEAEYRSWLKDAPSRY